MRFGFVTGGSSAKLRHDIRDWEVLEEVELAEEMGFDFFGCPEQHFLGKYCSTSAAECFYGAVAMQMGAYVTNSVGVLVVPAHCAETTKEARQNTERIAAAFTALVDVLYAELAQASSDYAYMGEVAERMRSKIKDMDYIMEESAGAIVGDPDDCIRQIKKFEAIGVQEILLGIDGPHHDKLMKSIELFGKYVIPHFKKIRAYP